MLFFDEQWILQFPLAPIKRPEMLGDHEGAQPCCLKDGREDCERSDVIDSERASTVELFLDEGFQRNPR